MQGLQGRLTTVVPPTPFVCRLQELLPHMNLKELTATGFGVSKLRMPPDVAAPLVPAIEAQVRKGGGQHTESVSSRGSRWERVSEAERESVSGIKSGVRTRWRWLGEGGVESRPRRWCLPRP